MTATARPWLREGRTVYALQDSVWLGKPAKENRFSFFVQCGTGCTEEEAEAVAAIIVRAVNNHEPVLAALRRSTVLFSKLMDELDIDPDETELTVSIVGVDGQKTEAAAITVKQVLDEARAAIAAAEKV